VLNVNFVRFFGLAAAVVAVTAGHASGATAKVGFGAFPGHVVQGTMVHVTVATRNVTTGCTLHVRYAGGSAQAGLGPAFVVAGQAQWSWEIPTNVQAGVAHATARCGKTAFARPFVVVGKLTTAPTPAAKVVVVRSGFSTRTETSGSTRLSYGLILHNQADVRDAGDITVQTNFVLADDHLLGTDTERISGIAAGSDFAYGNTVYFPGLAPVVRLEFVVSVDHFQPHALTMPTLENVHIEPQNFQPQWVGTIEGEIQNTNPTSTLQSAALSAVVLDASGAIIGGTSGGYVTQTLPTGARAFIQIRNLDVLPTDRAASALVSMYPTWAQS
jgi:hypothetical protein